jgi:polyhydroxyalkanoate synthesis regulator phasin
MSWMDGLNEDNKAALTDKNFEDLDSFAKSYLEMQTYQGSSLRIPTAEAGEEQWKEFRAKVSSKIPDMVQIPKDMEPEDIAKIMTKLGKPEEASGYEFDTVEGQSVSEGLINMMHKSGLTKSQAKEFAKQWMTSAAEESDTAKGKFNQDMAVLNTDWGQAKGNKVATAINLAEKTGAPAALIEAIKNGDADADTLKWLDKINVQFGGERSQFTSHPEGAGHDTPAEMEMKINDIMERKEYWQPGPQSQVLQQQVLALQMKINES